MTPKSLRITAADRQLAAHTATVEQLARLNPDRADALIKIAAFTLKEEQAKLSAARLRIGHVCPRIDDPEFVQLQPSASGVRAWRCWGCGAIVTSEKGGA
jgi:hypothetical protein